MSKGISGHNTFVLAVAVALGAAASTALAGISIVDQSAKVNRADDTARFTITFNQPPDFLPSEGGLPANSFQYEVDADWTGRRGDRPLDALSTVIRGDEISIADALRVRSADPTSPDPDPASGGWGPVLGTVPFELAGRTLTFDAPLALLGDDGDGVFAYRLFATNAGENAGIVEGHVIPLPMGALTGGAGILALAAADRARRRRASLG